MDRHWLAGRLFAARRMRVKVLLLTLAGLLILGFAIRHYRTRTNSLPIEPHAAEEIEKAKRR